MKYIVKYNNRLLNFNIERDSFAHFFVNYVSTLKFRGGTDAVQTA